jgi:uncharacterized protein YcbX
MTIAAITELYRYPIKGLSPEVLTQAALQPGKTVLGDRSYAIENGPIGFDPAAPKFFPKINFLMLMKNERLAALRTRFDDASQVLSIDDGGKTVAAGNLATEEGRAAIEAYFAEHFADELRGPPKVLSSPGYSFSDLAAPVISIINLASVASLEGVIGRPVHPLRFRGNLYVTGWEAWSERGFPGKELKIGHARLKVVDEIVRCAATNVDPVTAERDMEIPRTLMRHFGHDFCGVYAEVVTGGSIAPGDRIEIIG